MRNRGSAYADALLCRRLDLLANFFAYVAFNVVEVIDEYDVIAVTNFADDGVKAGRAVFFCGGGTAVGGYTALNVRLAFSDKWDAALAPGSRGQFARNLRACGLRSFDWATHPREHIRPKVLGRLYACAIDVDQVFRRYHLRDQDRLARLGRPRRSRRSSLES